MRPHLKILVIEDAVDLLEQITSSIGNTIAYFDRRDLDISLLEANSVSKALQFVREDGDIQAVVFSWDVVAKVKELTDVVPLNGVLNENTSPTAENVRSQNANEKTTSEESSAHNAVIDNNAKVIDAIKRIRPELPVYVLGDAVKGLDIVNQANGIESFFYRNDIISDPESFLGYIINDFDDRNETPFWTEYKDYVVESNDSWHTPGHSGGASFRNSPYISDFYRFFGRNVFVSDFAYMFSHFESDNIGHDPLKILIDVSALDYSNQEIHRFLMDEVGLEIEKFTHSTILVLLTLGGMRSKIVRLYNALKRLDDGAVNLSKRKSKSPLPADIPPIHLDDLPSKAFFSPREAIPWQNSVGRTAAGLITPYPPGIPLIVPGQKVEQAHIDYLQALASQKLTVQGVYDGEIYVVAEG
ncbi:MAG: Orn/Lys/Arg decarboxylase N-terminal domain-containing protein [Pseudomonadota bacterium]|nr:Orn/Lys/Arg decarboxylase N-terminal domain-containing protein [Pseudomonadota bacterium]